MKNQFEKSQEEPLGEERAHEEANTLRAMITEQGKRESTAEDYERALKSLDELKEWAEKEPAGFMKFLQKSLQYGSVPVLMGGIALYAYAEPFLKDLSRVLGPKESEDKFDEEGRTTLREHMATYRELKNKLFEDAKSRLQRMQLAGERFGTAELEKTK